MSEMSASMPEATNSAGQPMPAVGRVQTELRQTLADSGESSLRKYARLCVGRQGIGALLNYELRTMLLSGFPGGAGIVLRKRLYRSLLGRCGRGVVIGRNVTIRHPHRIELGDHVVIDDNCVLDGKGEAETTIRIGSGTIIGRNTVLSCKGGSIDLGQQVNISVNCTLISETQLSIGEKTLIAGHCYIIAGGNHGIERTDVPPVEQPCIQRGGVRIMKHVWLGAAVTVLDGVTIGRDAVVGAGAVVTRSLDTFTIAAGIPAAVIRTRGRHDDANAAAAG